MEIIKDASRSSICEKIDVFRLFKVNIVDTTISDAINIVKNIIKRQHCKPITIFFIHTSTLNSFLKEEDFVNDLNRADFAFADGTGVRWAARLLCGRKLKDNVNGTDLIPEILGSTREMKYRYFLLGAEQKVIEQAAAKSAALFPHSILVGYHNGFFKPDENQMVIEKINLSGAHILLVGMGNPLQERWIINNVDKLKVPLIIGVGGIFNYWAGRLHRAPPWIRRIGMEWSYILLQQPMKWRRYLIGNPYFLYRVVREKYKLGY